MKHLTLILTTSALSLTFTIAHAGGLKSLGNAITYPIKKGAHNTEKSVRTEAGGASRGINHGGQAIEYPIRKTGENTSKTTHKVVGK